MKNEPDKTNTSAGKIINELSRAAHIYFHAKFSHLSIGHSQITTLIYISRNEGISQIDLSKQLNIDKSSITSQLKILESNGYILRQASKKDARNQLIYITRKTEKILEPLYDTFKSWTRILLNGFSESEETMVFNYLERMQKNAKKITNEIKYQK